MADGPTTCSDTGDDTPDARRWPMDVIQMVIQGVIQSGPIDAGQGFAKERRDTVGDTAGDIAPVSSPPPYKGVIQ